MAAVSETKGHAVHRVRPGTPVFSRTPTFDDFIESHEASRKSDALGAWAKASVNVVSVASAKSASKGARKAPGRRDSRYWTDAERSSFEEALKLFKTDYHAVAKVRTQSDDPRSRTTSFFLRENDARLTRPTWTPSCRPCDPFSMSRAVPRRRSEVTQENTTEN